MRLGMREELAKDIRRTLQGDGRGMVACPSLAQGATQQAAGEMLR